MILILHDYWRSGASYRVRIALHLKGVRYHRVVYDLRAGAQRDPAYLALAPQGLVPALDTGAGVLTQSAAILEWLEERHPDPPLLPVAPDERAVVRAMAALIGCDIHPLNNLRVLQRLRGEGLAQSAIDGWIAHWMATGFAALERLVGDHGRGFAYGDRPTLADCYLVPQLYSARRFAVPLDAYPALVAAGEAAAALPAFADAHPDRQPDADPPAG
jgi:maleylpyruvate isomerase